MTEDVESSGGFLWIW